MKKPNILIFDLENYIMSIDSNGIVVIISLHKKNYNNKMSQWLDPYGYLRTKLNSKGVSVHSIVAKVTLGERPGGLVINHIDGNKLNNHPTNLEYCTIAANIKHAVKLGLYVSGNPTKHGKYIDGRSLDPAKYKHEYYLANRALYIARSKLRHEANRDSILLDMKRRYRENVIV